jgi:toxin ParE1/3/4
MRLFWSAQAQRELLDIADYYDGIDPALANAIVTRIDTAVAPLLTFPRMGAPVDRHGARKWRVPDTPFILIYDIAGNRIDVLGVAHQRSDWGAGS